jgi:hypothetical protein
VSEQPISADRSGIFTIAAEKPGKTGFQAPIQTPQVIEIT